MLKTGILNPRSTLCSAACATPILWSSPTAVSLLAADRDHRYFAGRRYPQCLDVLKAIRANFNIGNAFMAEEFRAANSPRLCREFEAAVAGVPLSL